MQGKTELQNHLIAVKIDSETKNRLEAYAKKTFRSMSAVVKYALKKLFEVAENESS